ncbi:MAG: thiamine pyrophosphate-dependent enzyme, partial [Achromobacter sp.]
DLSAMPVSAAMTQLQAPHLDWCGIARASGVAAYRVDAAEAFDQAFKACLATRGPTLIEVLC